jgi:hypothetical protein
VGAQHPALLVKAVDDADEEVLADQIVRTDGVKARPHAVGDKRHPRVEERQHLVLTQLTRGQRLQRRARGNGGEASVGRDTDGGEALGHFVVPVAVLLSQLVEEQMDRLDLVIAGARGLAITGPERGAIAPLVAARSIPDDERVA